MTLDNEIAIGKPELEALMERSLSDSEFKSIKGFIFDVVQTIISAIKDGRRFQVTLEFIKSYTGGLDSNAK